MIATHDSFTYLKPACPLWGLVGFAWRTQSRTIEEQVADGVGYFDLRVVRHGGTWYPAHGAVRLKGRLDALLEATKGRPFRLLLERGDAADVEAFEKLVYGLVATGRPLHEAVVKQGWKVVYRNSELNMASRDASYVPFHSDGLHWKELWAFLKHPSWPKRYAAEHNEEVGVAERNSPALRVYMDFYEL